MRLKLLEEENKDLKSKVESLLHSNERLKTELVNRAKSEKFSETRKYHDTKYKSKYSKSSTPTNKVRAFFHFFARVLTYYFFRLNFKRNRQSPNGISYDTRAESY